MPLKGVDEAVANTERFTDEDWINLCDAFEDVTLGVIMPECMEECPVDTGVLRESIPAVSRVEKKPDECIAIIGAGGAASAYALRQHEDLTLHHPPMTRGPGTLHSRNVAMAKYGGSLPQPVGQYGKAKYIEDPVMRNAPNIPAMIAARKGFR